MKQSERRGFERVEYLGKECPVFVVSDSIFDVVDCAERGLRYRSSSAPLPEVGSDVRGTVRFPEGVAVPVEGVVVRVGHDGVAIHFTQTWIDKEVIAGERRRLRGRGRRAR